jgi:hypothetical protein
VLTLYGMPRPSLSALGDMGRDESDLLINPCRRGVLLQAA